MVFDVEYYNKDQDNKEQDNKEQDNNSENMLAHIPQSIRIFLLSVCTSIQRIAHEQRFFSSGVSNFSQIVLGTTPNMAPPSNLKYPVSIMLNFITKDFTLLKTNFFLRFGQGFSKGCHFNCSDSSFIAFITMYSSRPV